MFVSIAGTPSQLSAVADEVAHIAVTTLTPEVLTEGMLASVEGTVTNDTSQPFNDVRVALQIDPNAIKTAADLAAVVSKEPTTHSDLTLLVDVLSTVNSVLSPGESATFTLEVDPLAHGLIPGAVYAIDLQLQQRIQGDWTSLAATRVLLTYLAGQGESVEHPTAVSVVALNSQPSLIIPAEEGSNPSVAVFANEHLGAELETRLNELLDYAEHFDANVVIDPLLYDEVSALAAGYSVSDSDATVVAGSKQAVAASWLNRLNTLLTTAGGRCYRGLSATPELAAVADTAYSTVVAAAASTLREGHPLAELPLAVLSITGRLDAVTLAYLAETEPNVIVSDSVATSTFSRIAERPVLVAAANLVARDGTSPSSATLLVRRTRLHAEQYLAWLAASPLVTVVTDQSQVLVETDMPTDFVAVPLNSLQPSEAPIVWVPTAAPPLQIPATMLDLVQAVDTDFTYWSHISPTPELVQLGRNTVVSAAWSASWAGDWASAANWLQQRAELIRTALAAGKIALKITPEWHISEDTTAMPVQLTNNMGVAVRVRVLFNTENEQRLSIPASDFVVIAPGETETIRVEPTVYGSGTLAVTARIQDGFGNLVGDLARFTVSSSTASALAWITIIMAGAAFLIATGLRVRHVRKYGKRAGPNHRSLVTQLSGKFASSKDRELRGAATQSPDSQADLS
ncbi:MAG: DUF6049 family protein [Propionibacteriaceae bacterium]|nr:DUF6049 family protein [Propionibacteriaceae bacterium]